MSKYKELVYMVLDELKISSDDAYFTEEHVIFLLNKYRTFLLKQRYSDIKKQIPESNYQTICVDLEQTSSIPDEPCAGETYLRSKEEIPYLMKISEPVVYPTDYYIGNITYISRNRMRFVGHNDYMQNIIYCSLGPDNHLYFKSSNPQYLYLNTVKVTGIFEDTLEAANLQCPDKDGNTTCEVIDMNFPIEDALISPLIELVVKELNGSLYKPKDSENNASDDLSNIVDNSRNNNRAPL